MLELRLDDLSGNYTAWEVREALRPLLGTLRPAPQRVHPCFYSTPMEDDEASFGTKVDFTHHSLRLPNADLAWTLSGNYLLEVFDPYAPERVVATRRFVVFEDLCRVEAQTGEPNDLALRRSHQEVHFSVFEDNYLSDPYDRLHISIVPNWRWIAPSQGLNPDTSRGPKSISNVRDTCSKGATRTALPT